MDFSVISLSAGVVALAEMGDKTQLLSLMLAVRYPKQAWPIIGGILIATLVNHAGAAFLGQLLASFIHPEILRWILGASFIVIGAWLLVPDQLEDENQSKKVHGALAVFLLTMMLFFLAEMGDKTQIATIALGARYNDVLSVTAGTTLGMMLANAPAVWIGQKFTQRVPLKWVHAIAAVVFIAIGLITLIWS
ncbi:TMEM165/GDT1 family protein [Polynucleobacter sp. MWH-P3-07-1]|uniref:TMEM165/GDT1 family protein n=1 Tax=Polynucleobacter sp. MWH-P3-07-1 TaxID=1743173 RepID=UPI001BFE96EF|nr:TMEM165/GDT1 family protein [Polynucleobacter sp. MWH-P3-07-1]QWD83973.1 TMEM165/GDT1 family protein [Polynucleobacter sp. MWH-P3-07-1]